MMRWVVLLLVVPLVGAESVVVLDDPRDDEVVRVGPSGDITAPRWDALDLISATVEQLDDETFAFTLELEQLHEVGAEFDVDRMEWSLQFTFDNATYRIYILRLPAGAFGPVVGEPGVFFARFQSYDAPTGRYAGNEFLDIEKDVADATLTVTVPRNLIVGASGALPRPGDRFTDFHAWSTHWFQTTADAMPVAADVEMADRMPNEGVGTIPFRIIGTDAASGPLWLASPARIRVSNGEATTMLFHLRVGNDQAKDDSVRLEALDVPKGWVVRFVDPLVKVTAGQTVEAPILVTTPFAHQHGVLETFYATATSTRDERVGARLEVGVRYADVPQPAGHHDTLYLHTDEVGWGFLNTLEDPPDDADVDARSRGSCSCNGISIARYDFDLLPGLFMGVDVDMGRKGTYSIPVRLGSPAQGVFVAGEVAVYPKGGDRMGFFNDDNPSAVVRLLPSQPHDFAGGDTWTFEGEIQGAPYGDYLPFLEESRMVLHLDVGTPALTPMCCLVEPRGVVTPGGAMVLPLSEYHDDVTAFLRGALVELHAKGPTERFVNPGEVVVFDVLAQNDGTAAGRFTASLSGLNAGWARVLGAASFDLQPGQTRSVPVAVTTPKSAIDGEFADVTLIVTSADAAGSVLRLIATVDTDEDHEDQRALADELDGRLAQKDAPTPFLLLALLVALLARRR